MDIHVRQQHPNIIMLHAAFEDENSFYLVQVGNAEHHTCGVLGDCGSLAPSADGQMHEVASGSIRWAVCSA